MGKLKIVYDYKNYAIITREDIPGKEIRLHLWDEDELKRLQEIQKEIEDNMEKSRIPYQPIPKADKRNKETILFILVLVAMLAIATIIKLNSP